MPAALLMSNVQAAVKALASDSMPSSELCSRVNRVLAGNLAPGSFVTMFYAVLDSRARTITFTNAGHCAPMVVRNNGTVERLEAGGALLGVFRNWVFEQGTGEERLEDTLRQCSGLDATETKDHVLHDIASFGGGEYQDDVTVVVIAVA
jgi:sigma-B regulation protein RsbU (phosphoserine phosphatase)